MTNAMCKIIVGKFKFPTIFLSESEQKVPDRGENNNSTLQTSV